MAALLVALTLIGKNDHFKQIYRIDRLIQSLYWQHAPSTPLAGNRNSK
jgi:hypothetical protein